MSGHSSRKIGEGHEQDLGFGRVFWIIPFSMILLVAYVAVCWFGAKSSLNGEMSRKQFQSMEAASNGGTSP